MYGFCTQITCFFHKKMSAVPVVMSVIHTDCRKLWRLFSSYGDLMRGFSALVHVMCAFSYKAYFPFCFS